MCMSKQESCNGQIPDGVGGTKNYYIVADFVYSQWI